MERGGGGRSREGKGNEAAQANEALSPLRNAADALSGFETRRGHPGDWRSRNPQAAANDMNNLGALLDRVA